MRIMDFTTPTLCSPDREKSCFACCPPIRPAGYEHIQFKNIVMRMLRENTGTFRGKGEGIVPIRGFSCWALGYLDDKFKLVGCLLHPARNGGVDLRSRIDYGDKCRRETCPEKKVFGGLDPGEKTFWLHLAGGLDSIAYSSPKGNPLFRMMGWGVDILKLVAKHADSRVFTRESFFRVYAFFSTTLTPGGSAYLIKKMISDDDIQLLESESFRWRFESLVGRVSKELKGLLPGEAETPYVHHLGFDRDYLDFLRLSCGFVKMRHADAARLKERLDQELEEFAAH